MSTRVVGILEFLCLSENTCTPRTSNIASGQRKKTGTFIFVPFTFQVCFLKKLSLSLYYFLVHLLPQLAAHTLSGQAVMQSSSDPGHPPDPPRVYIIEGVLPPFLSLLPLPGATTATTSTDSTDSESPHCTLPSRRLKSLHGCALHLH